MILKILTLNLHCFAEKGIPENQGKIANKILEHDIDVILLQEVAQTQNEEAAYDSVKKDNYGLRLLNLLHETNKEYLFYYEPIKDSFCTLDEGLGIISKYPLIFKNSKFISKTRDYKNWKTRKVMIYELPCDVLPIHFATTHFGWSDGYEVFEEQFDLASIELLNEKLSILAGDFNIREDSKEYQHIINSGWHDAFKGDKDFFHRPTFHGDESTEGKRVRLDYVMTNKPVNVKHKEIFFQENRVSDHMGVYVEIDL